MIGVFFVGGEFLTTKKSPAMKAAMARKRMRTTGAFLFDCGALSLMV